MREPCPTCKGKGYLEDHTHADPVLGPAVVPCPDCTDGTIDG